MINFSFFDHLVTVYWCTVIFCDIDIRSYFFGIRKKVRLSLGYPKLSWREKYWKVWNEATHTILEDDDIPF